MLNGPNGRHEVRTSLIGRHQINNALTAFAALESITDKIDRGEEKVSQIKAGLKEAWLPGRIDVLSTTPLIIADGAHTKESAEVMWKSISDLFQFERAVIVRAMNSDKDSRSIINAVCHENSELVLTKSRNTKSVPPQQLMTLLPNERQRSTEMSETVSGAIEMARAKAGAHDLILITGSLYAAGEAREHLCS